MIGCLWPKRYILGEAPPWAMLNLIYGNRGSSFERQIDRVLAELDFVQTVNDLVGAKTELNPSLNAVAEAFKRRQLRGAFVMDNHEVNLDALLHRDSIGVDDCDLSAPDVKKAGESKWSQRSALQRRDGRGIC